MIDFHLRNFPIRRFTEPFNNLHRWNFSRFNKFVTLQLLINKLLESQESFRNPTRRGDDDDEWEDLQKDGGVQKNMDWVDD